MPKKTIEYDNYKLKEKYLWYLGDEDLLADFYQSEQNNYTLINTRDSYYYTNVDEHIRVVHSGMPALICHGKARLLTNSEMTIAVVKGEEEVIKETALLNDILLDNKVETLLYNSIITQCWGKKFAWKISSDPELTEYPIIEKYSPFNYEPIVSRGRTLGYIFKEHYDYDKVKYELHEIYGKGFVDYKLYQVKKGDLVEVPLNMIDETKDLEPFKFKGDFILGGEYEGVKSDFDGIIAEFDALDEVWSQLMDEIRAGRAETYIPDILTTGKTFNDFRKKYVVTGTDDKENGKNEISHSQPEIRTEEYVKALLALRDNILANVGLNSLTIGIDDSIGANASGEALIQRETTSLRTRESLTRHMEVFLIDICQKLLKANDVFKKKSPKDYEIMAAFGDYMTPDRNTLIAQAKIMVDSDIIDNEKALDEIYGDELTEEEKVRILQSTGTEIFIPEEPLEE